MWDDRATRYESADTFHRALAKKLVAFASPSPGQHILDIASGTGMVAIPAAQIVKGSKGSVVGLDMSHSMLSEVISLAGSSLHQ